MFEDIQKHRQAVQENIEKAFEIGFTGNEDLEKAHQVGDIHPNGKWVWTQLSSGKFDWRVIKKQSQSTVPSQQNVNKQQKTEDGLTKEELEELRALESAARKGYKLLQRDANRLRRLQAKERELKQEKLMATQSQKTEEGKEVEVDKNSSEYKKAFSAAKKWASEIDERGREVELSAIKENLEAAKKIAENKDGKWSRNDVIRAKNSIVSETARKDAFEDVEKELKKKTKSTNDTQSDDKVKLTEGSFKKGVVEKDEYARKNAIDLHDYTGKSIEYYTDNGEKKKAQPYISEFYNSAKQDAVGGYEAYFDRADSIGTFRTLKEAISALETWINNMRVKGHAKPEWIYNESRGRYQMNYRFN